MQRYNGQLLNQFPNTVTGISAAGAKITVRVKSTGALATLYANNSTSGATLSNPLTADSKGYYGFYAPDGVYTLDVNLSGTPQLEIQLQDVASLQAQFNNAVSNAGYIPVGTFAAGCTVSQANGVVSDGVSYWRWDGALPKTVTAGSAPVPTGVGGWVLVSDGAFKNDLASPSSTVLISGTEASKLPKQQPPTPAATISVVDIHFGALRGRGATNTETFSAGIYSVASPASAGSSTITLTSNLSVNFSVALVVDQLICYLATDGNYYSAAIQSIAGAVLTLRSPISVGVAAGNNLFSFYQNEAHPTEYGYYAIADYALSKCRTAYKQVGTLEVKNAVGGASVTIDTTETINSVGSPSVPAYSVTCPTAASDGVSGSFTVKESGGYVLKFVINSGGTAGTAIITTGSYTNSTTFNSNEPVSLEIPVSVSNADGIISVFIKTNTNGGAFKVLRNVAVLKAQAVSTNMNGGKHVIIGDSWFEQGQFYARLSARLPQATIANKGVGGQNAGQIVGRFEADVFPEKPDVVWMISGTNDYYQNLSADLFNYYINRAKALCASIGAHLVLINSSVGAAQFSTTRFNLSRRLATETSYYDKDLSTSTGNEILISIPTTVVPNGSTVQLGNLGVYTGSITVTEYFIKGAGLKIGRKSSLTGLPTYLATFSDNTYTTADSTYTFSGGQFIELTGENTSGTSQTYYGYVKVRQ